VTLLVIVPYLELQEQLKAETHISEAAFRSLKLAQDEFQQTEAVNSEKQKQLQATIDDLSKTVELLNQTVQGLCEKQNYEKQNYVSTRKIEAVILSKWPEIPLAISPVKFRPSTLITRAWDSVLVKALHY
jgi:hypothetical protein